MRIFFFWRPKNPKKGQKTFIFGAYACFGGFWAENSILPNFTKRFIRQFGRTFAYIVPLVFGSKLEKDSIETTFTARKNRKTPNLHFFGKPHFEGTCPETAKMPFSAGRLWAFAATCRAQILPVCQDPRVVRDCAFGAPQSNAKGGNWPFENGDFSLSENLTQNDFSIKVGTSPF